MGSNLVSVSGAVPDKSPFPSPGRAVLTGELCEAGHVL